MEGQRSKIGWGKRVRVKGETGQGRVEEEARVKGWKSKRKVRSEVDWLWSRRGSEDMCGIGAKITEWKQMEGREASM